MLRYDAMPPGWQEDPQQLNRYAWWCFENQVDMERGRELALKGVELSPAGPERAAILDTAAELSRSLGEMDRALALLEQAVAEDPGNADYAQKVQEWRKADS